MLALISEFVEKFMPPIVPLPGGAFYIDFVKAYQMVKDWRKEKGAYLRSVRLDLKRMEWNRVVLAKKKK